MALRFLSRFISRSRPEPIFEGLEQRLAFYADPFVTNFPALSEMKNTNDTVVRMLTTQGIVDIEIYDRGGPPAVVTAANFLNYVKTGRYDNSFFHRLIDDFVLQGGGFIDDPTASPQYSAVVTDPPIVNEFNSQRKNLERTIAMAKLGGNPNSATSQFFFNLINNANLDDQNGGFTVFGKVIQGWDVVETIGGFDTRDLNTFLGGEAFTDVPLSGSANTDLVRIIDIEIIKAPDQLEFFSQSIYFPDGFRSGRIVSIVSLVNEDPNASALYQIIVRYESKTRDVVISSGTLVPGAHLEVPISRTGNPNLNLVKAEAPFSYVIRATKKVSATLTHKDFGATASEGFFQAQPYSADDLKSWTFAGGQNGPGIANFLVWENLAGAQATITITFSPVSPDTWTPIVLTKTLESFRRGGLDLNKVAGVPDGLLAIHLTSTQPLVAALSQYRAAPARASLELGIVAGGNTTAILPAAYIASTGQAVISVERTGDATTSVIVDFQFILSDGTVFTNNGTLTLASGVRSRRWDLSTLNGALPRDEYFTIRVKARNASEPIAATYYSITESDTVATQFQTASGKEMVFASGFTSDDASATGQEVISIFNPMAAQAANVSYRLRFHFVDGTADEIIIPTGGSGPIASNRRIDIPVRSLTDIMQRIASGSQYRNYSVSVSADITDSVSVELDGAIFAQLTRLDSGGSTVSTIPTLSANFPIFFANNPIFI